MAGDEEKGEDGAEKMVGPSNYNTTLTQSNLSFLRSQPFTPSITHAFCDDPFKLGGWVTEDRTSESNKSKYPDNKMPDGKNWTQFLWKKYEKSPHTFLPHDPHDTPIYCERAGGVDEKLKEILNRFKEGNGNSSESNDPFQYKPQNLPLPSSLHKELFSSEDNKTQKQKDKDSHHLHLLFQSDFRAYANVWTGDRTDLNPKAENKFNPSLERTLLQKRVIRGEVGWPTKEITNQAYAPLSLSPRISLRLSIYDPNSAFLYNLNYFDNPIFPMRLFKKDINKLRGRSMGIGMEGRWKVVGSDNGGFLDENKSKEQKAWKDYGLSGLLKITPYLTRMMDGKLLLNIELITYGFVNTRNPTCDPRHRLGDENLLSTGKHKCTSRDTWSYRPYLHIPSFLYVEIDKDNTRMEWYEDKKWSADSKTLETPTSFSSHTTLPYHHNSEVGFPEISAYYSVLGKRNVGDKFRSEATDYGTGKVRTTSSSGGIFSSSNASNATSLYLPPNTPLMKVDLKGFGEETRGKKADGGDGDELKDLTLTFHLSGSFYSSSTLLLLPHHQLHSLQGVCELEDNSRGKRNVDGKNDLGGICEVVPELKDGGKGRNNSTNTKSNLRAQINNIDEKNNSSSTYPSPSNNFYPYPTLAQNPRNMNVSVSVEVGDIKENGKEEKNGIHKFLLPFRTVTNVGVGNDGIESKNLGEIKGILEKLKDDMSKWENEDTSNLNLQGKSSPLSFSHLSYALYFEYNTKDNSLSYKPLIWGVSYLNSGAGSQIGYYGGTGLRGSEGVKNWYFFQKYVYNLTLQISSLFFRFIWDYNFYFLFSPSLL